MKTIVLGALTAMGLGSLVNAGPLMTPMSLAEDKAAPLILDIRGAAYDSGHIEGAVSAPYPLFRGPAENPGQLVPEEELEQRLRALGVTLDRPVVVVHQGSDDTDFGAAARVYWTLKSSGVTDLAILNGGMDAWRNAGLPVDDDPVVPVPSDVDIIFSDQWLASRADVQDIVAGRQNAALVDARPPAYYEGSMAHPAADRPGTLPGAQNLPHSEFFGGSAQIGDTTLAQSVAARLGLGAEAEVVSFCNTGHWAATEWFALSELAGMPNVKLYPESIVGYSQSGGEMENTPNLFQNLLRQVRGAN
ncbi:sulfurtransferase [Falsirhodobacter sp. alg1]|uniref:sulfurtransferase n=1 Tax=Falsirhodobacter sp. alg1 TaxID=1472418 RepID=UPI0005EF1D4F|nr:rhodanese-like domain-containing protein [Falsirhodobacter sp. alg1]